MKKFFIVRRSVTMIDGKPHVETYSEQELVRCKNCKHGEKNDLGEVICEMFSGDNAFHPENWYCADGERK